MNSWHPHSWQEKQCHQPIDYPSISDLNRITQQISTLPPLVTPLEVNHLKKQLGEAALGQRFLLQGGDCAESFAECQIDSITNKIKILLQMSLVLLHELKTPIIRVGRIAGQYAKPRSNLVEIQNNQELPSYRGDLINHPDFSLQSRTPDPKRMLQGYSYSTFTLNYIRALLDGGFANVQHPEYWEMDFAQHSPFAAEYRQIAEDIRHSLSLSKVTGADVEHLQQFDIYTSHEAHNLYYEAALTRQENQQWYNLSTHFPWVGMRTNHIDGAHIEYLSGIANPIAIKVGPNMSPTELIDLIEHLNPNNEPGRLTLIHRFGAEKIASLLPALIHAAHETGKTILWCCDPMHGNTQSTKNGIKTRHFKDILSELEQALNIHRKLDSHLGGLHFEMTGENVTECIGGARGLTEDDLQHAYKSLVDPRLNYEQALEMALLVVKNS